MTGAGRLAASNAERQRSAAAAGSIRAQAALDRLGRRCPPQLAAAGLLRIEHPDVSLAELGELAGLSKDAVAARLRRLYARAGT
jgi:cell division protein WhiA